jgi:DNA polymerase elongation subunit (family B)
MAGMGTGDFLVIDIETSGGSMQNIPEGFNLLVTGLRRGNFYAMYTSEPESLAALADQLESFAGPLITFNGARFDLPVLDRWCNEVLDRPLVVQQHYDLMREIINAAGRRISLDQLCFYTFGEEKLKWDHRRNAEVWATEPQLLIDYNKVDVDLTHELFMRVLRDEPLFLGDATVELRKP